MYQTYIYQLEHKENLRKDSICVWSDCETTAFKAVFDAFGQSFNIGSYETLPQRFYAGISTD